MREKNYLYICLNEKEREGRGRLFMFCFGPFGNWLAVQKREKEYVLVPKFKDMDEKI